MIMAGRSEAAYAPILSLVVLLAHSRSPVSYLTWYYARKVSTKINNWMGNKIFKKKLEYRIIDLISVSVCFFFLFSFFCYVCAKWNILFLYVFSVIRCGFIYSVYFFVHDSVKILFFNVIYRKINRCSLVSLKPWERLYRIG